MAPKLPALKKVRLLFICALDSLPRWHPTFQAAARVRGHLRAAKKEVEAHLGPDA